MKNILILLLFSSMVSCHTPTKDPIEYGSNPLAGKYVDVNDIKVYYEIYGEGEPVLLLHGNGSSIESFIYQIPELSKHFKVIAIDSRAQGRSTDSDKDITYALMASDMSELIDKLNLVKVNVVGWSDGGIIGLELAYAHPEKVLKVITFGANYTYENFIAPPDNVIMEPNDPLIVKISEGMQRHSDALERLSPNPERIPTIEKKLSELTQNYPTFTTNQLTTIDIPFLIVVGDHDLIRIEHTISLFTNLRKAQLLIVPRASHLVPVEYPELINSEVIRFLKTPYRDINRYYFSN